MAGLTQRGSGQAPEQVRDPIKAFGVEQADETPQHADKGEPHEVSRVGEVVTTSEAEQRREPHDGAEDDIADERCDEAWQQSRCVKVVPVEDLACQYCSSQWCAEDGADAGPNTGDDSDAGVSGTEVQFPCEERREAGADLSGRSLSASRAAGPDCESGCHDLDDHGPESDSSGVVVDGRDGGIGAVTLGLGREPEHDDSSEQRTEANHQGQGPRSGERFRSPVSTLADRRRHVVASQRAEEEVGAGQQGLVEHDGTDSCHRPDEHAEDQPLLEVGRAAEPTRRSGHGGPPRGTSDDHGSPSLI